MHIKIYNIGKIKEKYILSGEAEYLKRLKSFMPVELIEVRSPASASEPEQIKKKKDTLAIISKLEGAGEVFILDERGQQFTSIGFADLLRSRMVAGKSLFSFAIGGPLGWEHAVIPDTFPTFSLSPMTFPSRITRLILIEQLYRAASIIKGEPYHN